MTLSGSVWGLLGACVLLGTGHLCSVVGQQSLVANRTPRRRYDSAFGHYTFAASAGQAIGPGLIIAFGGADAIPDTEAIFAWSAALGGRAARRLALPAVQPTAVGRRAAEARIHARPAAPAGTRCGR